MDTRNITIEEIVISMTIMELDEKTSACLEWEMMYINDLFSDTPNEDKLSQDAPKPRICREKSDCWTGNKVTGSFNLNYFGS